MDANNFAGKDLYAVLGLQPSASLEEIKSEYRWLAKKFHPDMNKNDDRAARRFQEINEAYEVLSNPDSRANYDRARLETNNLGQKPPYPNRGTSRDHEPGPKPTPPTNPQRHAYGKEQSPQHKAGEESSRRLGLFIALPVLGVVLVSSLFVAIGVFATANSQPRSSGYAPTQAESRSADLQTCSQFWNYSYPSNWYNSIEAAQGVANRIGNMAATGNSLPVRGAVNGLVSQMQTYAATLRLQAASGVSIANGNEFAIPNVISADERLERVCEGVLNQ